MRSDNLVVYDGPLKGAVASLKVGSMRAVLRTESVSQRCGKFGNRLKAGSCADGDCGVQKLSLFSCAVTVAACPIIIIFDASATSLGAKAGIAATLCSFGLFTTCMRLWHATGV